MPGSSPLVEHVYFNPPAPQEADSWWARYKAQLTGLTDTARRSVEADSLYILQRGILAADTAKTEERSSRRSRTGLVMGSVQSGKTASMLGVSALAIDNGLDIIVVLAGSPFRARGNQSEGLGWLFATDCLALPTRRP